MMMTKTNIKILLDCLDSILPNASCELNYSKDYELAIAVMLSAQTSDVMVNNVTSILFNRYKSIEEFANADVDEIEKIIYPIGLAKNKANNVKKFAIKLVDEFNGVLPSDKNILVTFPGIGNKSAGVIRAEVFKIPDLPVDTHILRISKRLNLANQENDPLKVELKLKKLIEPSRWIKAHHQLIHFGRYYCLARNPKCDNCPLKKYCSIF